MNLNDFSKTNRLRCESALGFNHPLDSWSLSDWMTATLGELGEAANVAKKLNRVRDGIPGNKETDAELRAKLASELADTFIYLDLLAQAARVDLPAAVAATFNRKSAQIGCPITLPHPPRIAGLSGEALDYLQAAADERRDAAEARCPACGGSGGGEDPPLWCRACNGKGTVAAPCADTLASSNMAWEGCPNEGVRP